jgi:hypothetical protein
MTGRREGCGGEQGRGFAVVASEVRNLGLPAPHGLARLEVIAVN